MVRGKNSSQRRSREGTSGCQQTPATGAPDQTPTRAKGRGESEERGPAPSVPRHLPTLKEKEEWNRPQVPGMCCRRGPIPEALV